MTRKDSEKDSERPHYYSQFWLDVAAGRRIIGAPKPEDESADSDVLEPTIPLRKSTRSASYDEDSDDSQFNGHSERIVHPVAEPLATPEDFDEPDTDELDLETSEPDALDLQEELVDDMDIPDMDLGPAIIKGKDEDEDGLEDEDEAEEGEGEVTTTNEENPDEEEEDLGWGGRGRKRNKPVRPKVVPKKAPRREPRRGY